MEGTVWKRALLLKGEERASGLIPETEQEASEPVCVFLEMIASFTRITRYECMMSFERHPIL